MHPIAWFVWLAASAGVSLLTRNPLYLLVVFGIACVVAEDSRSPDARGSGYLPISPLRFAGFALIAGALINGLTSHFGETVLVRLPDAIPLLGGPITVEGLAYGAINGMVLATLYAAFAVLSVAVPVRDLIGYLPRAFYPAAVVSAIAVTFVPNTLRQFQQVREAQAIRGHRMRGLRDWLPLFMPVLIGGLEKALQLAETMTARGFAAASAPEDTYASSHEPRIRSLSLGLGRHDAQIGLAIGLGCVLAASVLRLVPGGSLWSSVALVGGVGVVVTAVWRSGQSVRYTRYRQSAWTWRDSLTAAGGALAVASFLLWPNARTYTPYPALDWPTFDLRVGVALLGLLVPVLVRELCPYGSVDHHV